MYRVVCRALLKPRLGMRRISGIWPPSNRYGSSCLNARSGLCHHDRSFCRGPLDSPWPSRLRRCFAPGRGFKLCKRIKLSCCGRGCGRLDRDPAAAINLIAQPELFQRMQRGLHHVGRVLRAERLAQHVLPPADSSTARTVFPAITPSRATRGATKRARRNNAKRFRAESCSLSTKL